MDQKSISSDLIRGHIDTIILYSLIDGDKHAQQISDSIEEKSNGDYKMIQATLYSSLKRLETLKLVSSYWFDSVDVGGRRKFFSITELGKTTVKNNLDNWSFSRALIDKLVDCEPAPVYKTQVVEKIVEVPVEKIVEIPVEVQVEKVVEVPVEVSPEKPVIQDSTPENTQNNVGVNNQLNVSQEINFRNILNGLIKSTAPQKQVVETTELKPVEKVENYQENTDGIPVEKLKFNDTISIVDYNEQKASNNGKIDFGDLILKAAKEGYKIRISSKDSTAPSGRLLVNKLNFVSVLFVFLLAFVEFGLVCLEASGLLGLNGVSIAITYLFLAVVPVVFFINYAKDPEKRSNKVIGSDKILTSAIIVFNLLLITFAGCLLLDVDFSDKFSLLVYVLMPCAVYFDVLVYSIIRYFLAKNKAFYVKK